MKNSAAVWVALVFSIISTLLSIAIVAYLAGTFYLDTKQDKEPTQSEVTQPSAAPINESETSENIAAEEPDVSTLQKTEQYCDRDYGFSFEYPTNLIKGLMDKNDISGGLALTFEGRAEVEQIGVFKNFGTGFENYDTFDTDTIDVVGEQANWTKSADSDDKSYLALVTWEYQGDGYAFAVFFDHEYKRSDDAIVEDLLASWSYDCVI